MDARTNTHKHLHNVGAQVARWEHLKCGLKLFSPEFNFKKICKGRKLCTECRAIVIGELEKAVEKNKVLYSKVINPRIESFDEI